MNYIDKIRLGEGLTLDEKLASLTPTEIIQVERDRVVMKIKERMRFTESKKEGKSPAEVDALQLLQGELHWVGTNIVDPASGVEEEA